MFDHPIDEVKNCQSTRWTGQMEIPQVTSGNRFIYDNKVQLYIAILKF